jgi:hypothetical protein
MSHVLRILFAFLLAIAPAALASAAIAHTAGEAPPDADDASLAPGGYVWSPDRAPSGPVQIVVSLSAQRAYVYRNGVRIGMSEASTGKEGHETPTGTFTILEKEKVHRSSRYNDAPMPYMQRLTWYGVALHGGPLPGYAASHGCIRLPLAFARKLFAVTSVGTQVVVTDDDEGPNGSTASELETQTSFAPDRQAQPQADPGSPPEVPLDRP